MQRTDLAGQTIVITGGAGILGSAMAARFSLSGANVVIIEPEIDRAKAAAEKIEGGNVLAIGADISRKVEVEEAARIARARFGAVTGLVNNAATKSENFFEPFETFSVDEWNEVLSVNLTGAMICSQVFGAPMARDGGGVIVNIASIYGVVAPDQRIYEGSLYEGGAINTPAVYSASKAALIGLTKYLAAYWGSAKVRVNAVSPGGVFSGQNDVFVDKYSARTPLNRMAEREEIAGAVSFLLSPSASYVTGQNLVVDGGLSAW